jgi:hypothetical protein
MLTNAIAYHLKEREDHAAGHRGLRHTDLKEAKGLLDELVSWQRHKPAVSEPVRPL